jgi:hypothetical protein
MVSIFMELAFNFLQPMLWRTAAVVSGLNQPMQSCSWAAATHVLQGDTHLVFVPNAKAALPPKH